MEAGDRDTTRYLARRKELIARGRPARSISEALTILAGNDRAQQTEKAPRQARIRVFLQL